MKFNNEKYSEVKNVSHDFFSDFRDKVYADIGLGKDDLAKGQEILDRGQVILAKSNEVGPIPDSGAFSLPQIDVNNLKPENILMIGVALLAVIYLARS